MRERGYLNRPDEDGLRKTGVESGRSGSAPVLVGGGLGAGTGEREKKANSGKCSIKKIVKSRCNRKQHSGLVECK